MKPAMKSFLQINPETGSIWSLRETGLPPVKRLMLRLTKICLIAVRAPFNKQLVSHASALSFTFLLSLIPLLAMVFSIAKGFGIQDKIEPLLLEKAVGGEIASDLAPKIIEYVNNTNVAALGSIGLLFIAYTAISMLGQIENSFNQIWGIKNPRTFIRKSSDYLAILIIGPLLFAVTMGFSTTMRSHAFTQKLLEIGLFAGAMKLFILSLPWITSILILTLLYVIIPNTTVRFSCLDGRRGHRLFLAADPDNLHKIPDRRRQIQRHLWNLRVRADFHDLAADNMDSCAVRRCHQFRLPERRQIPSP